MTNTQELRRLAEVATPGPWEDVHPNADDGDIRVQRYHAEKRCRLDDEDTVAWKVSEPNAAFIAAANPQAVLALLDELDALRSDRTTRDREKFNEGIDKAEQIAWNGRDEEGRKTARAVRALRLPEPEKEGK